MVLKADRGNVMAAQILAEAFLLQDRVQEALDLLQRTARRSQEPGTETLLAMALNAAGRADEALEQLRRATMGRPVFPLAFLKLGEQLGEIGRFDEAIAVLEGGLALVPDGVGLRVGLGFIHLGRNERDVARRLFLQVLATAPERHDATVGLARVMVLDGEYAAAADLLRRALALRPEDVATLLELGKCQLEMGARSAEKPPCAPRRIGRIGWRRWLSWRLRPPRMAASSCGLALRRHSWWRSKLIPFRPDSGGGRRPSRGGSARSNRGSPSPPPR